MASKVQPKATVDELLQSMNTGVVREKGVVEPLTTKVTGKGGKSFPVTTYIFRCKISDDHTTYSVSFDRIHFDSFEVGDRIGFEFKEKGQYLVVQKRHRIHNITKSRGEKAMNIQLRPREEIQHLIGRCDKRFKEIVASIQKHPPHKTKLMLESEKKEVIKLGGLAFFVLNGTFPPHEDYDPRKTFACCTIVTRYLGEESLSQILERAQKRLDIVSSTVEESKKSVEYIELEKFIVALKWFLLQATDTQLGLHFTWNIFGRKLKDDYLMHGVERDEFLQKDRRANDLQALKEDAAAALAEIHAIEQKKRLSDRFAAVSKKGGFDIKDSKKK